MRTNGRCPACLIPRFRPPSVVPTLIITVAEPLFCGCKNRTSRNFVTDDSALSARGICGQYRARAHLARNHRLLVPQVHPRPRNAHHRRLSDGLFYRRRHHGSRALTHHTVLLFPPPPRARPSKNCLAVQEQGVKVSIVDTRNNQWIRCPFGNAPRFHTTPRAIRPIHATSLRKPNISAVYRPLRNA